MATVVPVNAIFHANKFTGSGYSLVLKTLAISLYFIICYSRLCSFVESW